VTPRQLMHLAAAMAHEVRNPLNSMAIHAELIEGRLKREGGAFTPADRDAVVRSAHLMASEVERIDRILDEYLQFAGPEEASRRLVEAGALVAAAIERARAHAHERGVELAARGVRATSWTLDADAIGDALDAVIRNAIDASPRGATVEIAAATQGDEAELIVTDHGEGIDPEVLGKIFMLGFSTRERAGIGLTVAKQIVKGHGGSITAASDGLGQGAAITLRLPLEVEA